MPTQPLLNTQLAFVRDRNGLGIPVLPNLPSSLSFPQGNIWHVRPRYGSDVTASGRNPQSAFKTLKRALAAAVANQNDVVLFYGEGNASASCTDYQSTQLDWNKDLVHLIGVNSGSSMSQRARITSISTYAAALPIFKVSANGCLIKGVSVFLGTADATPLGAVTVTGSRNKFENCHILGFGNAANDIVGGYSLLLDGAEENDFVGCVIGSDRIKIGASANSQILTANTAKNNSFINSVIKLWTAHATNSLFLRVPTASLEGVLRFTNSQGINSVHISGGTALTYGSVVASDAGGDVIFDALSGVQATDINSTDAGNVYVLAAAAATGGLIIPALR